MLRSRAFEDDEARDLDFLSPLSPFTRVLIGQMRRDPRPAAPDDEFDSHLASPAHREFGFPHSFPADYPKRLHALQLAKHAGYLAVDWVRLRPDRRVGASPGCTRFLHRSPAQGWRLLLNRPRAPAQP